MAPAVLARTSAQREARLPDSGLPRDHDHGAGVRDARCAERGEPRELDRRPTKGRPAAGPSPKGRDHRRAGRSDPQPRGERPRRRDGATPSSRAGARRAAPYTVSAAARSPIAASCSISRRWASSASGSRAAAARACASAAADRPPTRRLRQARERPRERRVLGAGGVHPVVVDPHEQLAVTRCDRSRIVAVREQLGERAHVHPEPIALDPRTRASPTRQSAASPRAARSSVSAARRLVRALAVEHVGPEEACQPAAGMPARMERQPGEQAPPTPRAGEVERRRRPAPAAARHTDVP